MIFLQKIFRTDYNTAATVIGSFGISLGTVVMTPVSVYVTDNFGFRNRFRVAGKTLARWYNFARHPRTGYVEEIIRGSPSELYQRELVSVGDLGLQ